MKHPLHLIIEYELTRTEAQLLLIVPHIKMEYFTKNIFVRYSIKYKVNKIFAFYKKIWCYHHLNLLFDNKIFESRIKKGITSYKIMDIDKRSIHKNIFEWYAYSGDASNSNDIKIIYAMLRNKGKISRSYITTWLITNPNSAGKIIRRLIKKQIIISDDAKRNYILSPKLYDFLNI